VAIALLAVALIAAPLFAAQPLKPANTPPDISFNKLHDFDEVVGFMKGWAAAYPSWVKLESIGKSIQGRDMWLLTITNPSTGAPETKPAMYVDGNTHANEVQGGEATLYTIDFLLRNYGRLDRVTELLDRVTFYCIPVVNPDGRARWFKGPSNEDFPRTVMVPVDDDRDGLTDEDGYDDMDGDGIITQMRKHVPLGQGRFKLDPKDPRILREIDKDELGDWIILGNEGFDNDRDGRVNEDLIGYVDPNRTWGWGWEPEYVQGGAGLYPLSIPESHAIATWAAKHPNIAAMQSFHNNGQMILRGPDAKSDPPYPHDDIVVYDNIGKEGEQLLPGYNYYVTWKDLYTVHGGTTEHFYRLLGALAFTNELYEAPVDLDKDGKVTDEERMKFNDLLTYGRQFVPWHKVNHPQYGEIEVGGFRQDTNRVPESWLEEEDMHRNAMFVLFNAWQLPRISFGDVSVKRVDGKLWRIEVPVLNDRGIPTMLAIATKEKLFRPDIATVSGAKVVSSGIVQNQYLDKIDLQDHRPERLMVPGVGGMSTRILFFLVEGSGNVTVKYDSVKAGTITKTVALR